MSSVATVDSLLAQLRTHFTRTLADNIIKHTRSSVDQGREVLCLARSHKSPSSELYYTFFSRFSKQAETSQLQQEIDHALKEGFRYACKHDVAFHQQIKGGWANFLVTNLVEKGDLEQAWKEVEKMKEKGEKVFDYTSGILIDKLKDIPGGFEKCMELWKELSQVRNHTQEMTYHTLVRLCIKERRIEEGREVMTWIREKGLKEDPREYYWMVEACVEKGDYERCKEVMKQGRASGTMKVDYGGLLEKYVEKGEMEKCEKVKEMMEKDKITPTVYTNIIKAYNKEGNKEKCMEVYKEMRDRGMTPNAIIFNILMEMCGEKGDLQQTLRLYEEMLSLSLVPHGHTYHALAMAYAKGGDMKRSKEQLKMMTRAGFPTAHTYNKLIGMLGKEDRMEEVKEMVENLRSGGERMDKFLYTTLINVYGDKGDVGKCVEMKRMMEKNGVRPTVVTFNTLIHACAKAGDLQKCDEFMREMTSTHHFSPSSSTFATLIEAFGKGGKKERCEGWYNNMVKMGITPTERVRESLKRYLGDEWMQKNGL